MFYLRKQLVFLCGFLWNLYKEHNASNASLLMVAMIAPLHCEVCHGASPYAMPRLPGRESPSCLLLAQGFLFLIFKRCVRVFSLDSHIFPEDIYIYIYIYMYFVFVDDLIIILFVELCFQLVMLLCIDKFRLMFSLFVTFLIIILSLYAFI